MTIKIPQILSSFRFIKVIKNDKKPFENDWQNTANYEINSKELLKHLEEGGNYGVIGGKGKLIIDIDKKSPDFKGVVTAADNLPKTFTTKTVNGGFHLYFLCDDLEDGIRLRNEAGEVRATGMMVVGPESTIDDKRYEIILHLPIAKVSKKQIEETFKKWLPERSDEDEEKPKTPDKTRSGQEWGVLCKKIESGKDKEKIFEEMKLYAKWSEAGTKYQQHQYKKAQEHIEKKKQKTIEKIENKYDLKSLAFDVLMKIASHKKSEATEEIVKKIIGNEHIYTTRDDERAQMWIYQDGIYVPQAKTYIKEICRTILGEAYTTNIVNEIISKIEAGSYVEQDDFFKNEQIEEVAIESGILNIMTREITPFTPQKKFFSKRPIKYNENAECPAISKHFETVLKYKEDVPVLEELFGYLLLRENKIERAFMFIGSGRNGKGKTLELMKRFVGIDNCASIPLQQLEDDNFAMGELFNKMANIAGDLDKKALKHTGAFKTLTGRDLISASRKFLTRVKFTNYAKLIFACNELPITYDLTYAFWDRWIVLEFPYVFVTQKEFEELEDEEEKSKSRLKDPDIIKKIATEEELSGLLNLALNGLSRLLDNNSFSYSKNTEEVHKLWLRKSSSFNAFLMDCVEEDWDTNITKTDLRHAYSEYCREHKLKGIGDRFIRDILATTFGASDDRESIDGVQKAVWVGIRLKEGQKEVNGKEEDEFEENEENKTQKKLFSNDSEVSNGNYTFREVSSNTKGGKHIPNLTNLTNFDLSDYILIDGSLDRGLCNICSKVGTIIAEKEEEEGKLFVCGDCWALHHKKE